MGKKKGLSVRLTCVFNKNVAQFNGGPLDCNREENSLNVSILLITIKLKLNNKETATAVRVHSSCATQNPATPQISHSQLTTY